MAGKTMYIHGESSLAMSIIKLAQSFCGQCNLPLLCEDGAFGSRTQNGKDHASPRKFKLRAKHMRACGVAGRSPSTSLTERCVPSPVNNTGYIFTRLRPYIRALFPSVDDPVLGQKVEEGVQVEPEFFIPTIPLLCNGANGIA